MAISNRSQLKELRSSGNMRKKIPGCPLGHLKTKLFEFHLISDWDNFLRRVQSLMHLWGHSPLFTDNELAEVSEKMFHFIVIELNKMKLKLTTHVIPLLEEAWRGYPIK